MDFRAVFSASVLLTIACTVCFASDEVARTSTIVSSTPEEHLNPMQISSRLLYAQSREAWSTLHDIRGAEGNINQINQVLRSNYGTFEETFASASLQVNKIATGIPIKSLQTAYFGVSSDALAYGKVEDPVVPQLHADAAVTGTIRSGFEGLISSSGTHIHFGGLFGMGVDKRIDAVSTDLIEKLPINNGRLSIYGLELGANQDFELPYGFLLNTDLSFRDAYFTSTAPVSDLSPTNPGETQGFQRWKIKNDLRDTSSSLESLHFEAIAGPQPLPVDLLPITWDYAHQLNSLPELGAMLGAGLAWHEDLGAKFQIVSRGGFYGGYPGGEVSLYYRSLGASFQSWGIEGSGAYQTLGQRLWIGSLTLAL